MSAAHNVEDTYLTPEEVSARYNNKISVRTLANWRSSGNGPPFVKMGKILYKLSALLEWEAKRTASNTSQYRN